MVSRSARRVDAPVGELDRADPAEDRLERLRPVLLGPEQQSDQVVRHRGSLPRVQHFQADALVVLALALRADDAYGAHLGGREHVRAAVGLLVETDDVDDAQRVDRLRDQVGAGADQRGVGVGQRARHEVDQDLVGLLDLVVDALLDPGAEVGGHRGEREVEASLERLHVAAGDRDAVVGPDHPAQDVQRRVGAHQLVAAGPVEDARDLGPGSGRSAVDHVPDRAGVSAYGFHRQRAGRCLDGAEVVGLAATAGVERRAVEPDPVVVRVDLGDPRVELVA